MADAGRILIIPKGDYDANSTYEKLDLVKYKGTSWLAKKDVTGVEPSEGEYWQNMFAFTLADNLTTAVNGYALDARQGKILNDKLGKFSSIFQDNAMDLVTSFTTSGKLQNGNMYIMFVNNAVNTTTFYKPSMVLLVVHDNVLKYEKLGDGDGRLTNIVLNDDMSLTITTDVNMRLTVRVYSVQ